MRIVICPGIHSPDLTAQLIQALPQQLASALIFPADQPVYSGVHVLAFLQQQLSIETQSDLTDNQNGSCRQAIQTPILLIGFSAGVVGAITAAHRWQTLGGQVVALIAVDGWGVPLVGSFPIHRLSHDHFTHWSSALLGAGQESFYADPAIDHLSLWGAPQLVQGWSSQSAAKLTAAQFLELLLQRYGTSKMKD